MSFLLPRLVIERFNSRRLLVPGLFGRRFVTFFGQTTTSDFVTDLDGLCR